MTELTKIIVVLAVAYAAYTIFLGDGGAALVKNIGTLKVGGSEEQGHSEEHAAPHSQEFSAEQLAKKVQNSQIQEIPDREAIYSTNPDVLPHPQMSNNYAPQGNFQSSASTGAAPNFSQLDCYPKDQLVPQDLLPREGGFSESNPAPQGVLSNRNFFESGYHGGLNTQGNKRCGNLQLRSDPLIPRVSVGPWNQSTSEADTNRRPFEIGSA